LGATWKVITSEVFTQLRSLSVQQALQHDSVVRMIGGYYTRGFSGSVIPA